MSGEIVLETENLTKEFAGFVAVSDVNLKVERGTIHALIGPNGAGKTTCFNLLTKFLTPTRARSNSRARTSRSFVRPKSRVSVSAARSRFPRCFHI
jgi:ABC-type branched-subunit amino acid transport system ATPase component